MTSSDKGSIQKQFLLLPFMYRYIYMYMYIYITMLHPYNTFFLDQLLTLSYNPNVKNKQTIYLISFFFTCYFLFSLVVFTDHQTIFAYAWHASSSAALPFCRPHICESVPAVDNGRSGHCLLAAWHPLIDPCCSSPGRLTTIFLCSVYKMIELAGASPPSSNVLYRHAAQLMPFHYHWGL